ncbi:hypothetical protein K438DRAFT_904188 [Mycena galopus ATCC 62051]|nr:hypothetical protein K438DRAFT_904188 [Mycena galopus ATCC 62051]
MAAVGLLLFTLLTFSTRARAALTNLTIDDANLTYFTWTEDPGIEPVPTIPWAAISPGDPCLYCSAQPPDTDIHDQTWHDGSNNSAGSFTFQGLTAAQDPRCTSTASTSPTRPTSPSPSTAASRRTTIMTARSSSSSTRCSSLPRA